MRFTAEHGMADHGAAGTIFQGWVTALRDDPAAGLATLEEGLARQRAIATNEDLSVYLCLLAECLLRVGRADEAVARLTQELPGLEAAALWIWMPELYRMLGEAILTADPGAPDAAERRFGQAAALAASQEVPMLALTIALSRARLRARHEGAHAAAPIVVAALQGIPEPDDSAHFADAARFLQELGAAPLVPGIRR
jgi:predicted ATPase